MKKYLEEDIQLNKKQKIIIVSLLIIISGVFGWLYEYIFYYINSGFKEFYMRGGNYLPWINIYAYGSFLIIWLTYKKRKKPLQVLIISMISTGILELCSGYILYDVLGWTRCWDYNQEILNFGNIGGFVCLRSVTFFGLSGLLLIYGILPFLIKISQMKYEKIILLFSISFSLIFILDELYNLLFYPFFPIPKASDFYKEHGFKYLYFENK